MTKMYSETRPIGTLSTSELATMFGLLSLEFLGVSRQDFLEDLSEKDVVMLLRKEHSSGEIVGFSTLMTLDLNVTVRKVKAIFSGDTTVLPEYRSSTGFGIEIGQYFMSTMKSFPDHEVYYVLISKGWRTYKILPFFFREFAPKFDTPLSSSEQQVINEFGIAKYPKDFDQAKGLIVFSRETQRLIPGSVDALPPENPDLHIKFFLEKNPTYLSGTELVCVAQVSERNFAPGMKRLLRSIKSNGGEP